MAQMGGAKKLVQLCTYRHRSAKFSTIGIHAIAMATRTNTKSLYDNMLQIIVLARIPLNYLPTISCSFSEALLRILHQMSIVKMVLQLLKTDVKDDISADIITAIITPLAPVGI